MKKMLLAVLGIALVSFFASTADATINHNGKLALYLAGPTGSGTCEYVMGDCTLGITHKATPKDEFGVFEKDRFDLYLMAIDVYGIAGARYGLTCEITQGVGFFFYGWTKCSDFEIPEAGFAGCGKGNAQTWVGEQAGPHVTMGILDTYVYPGTIARLCVSADPRVGFAELCDGSDPSPLCNHIAAGGLGCFGVNRKGYNPCGEVPTVSRSWGAVKSLYR
jgi:hypothetical protein